jgi:hypothetical protein
MNIIVNNTYNKQYELRLGQLETVLQLPCDLKSVDDSLSKKQAYAFTLTLYLASSMASAFVMELTAPWNKKMK